VDKVDALREEAVPVEGHDKLADRDDDNGRRGDED
jgi:hypothetical protein